jgi:hypothetical protein
MLTSNASRPSFTGRANCRRRPSSICTLAADVLRNAMFQQWTSLLRTNAARTLLTALTSDAAELLVVQGAVHGVVIGITAL